MWCICQHIIIPRAKLEVCKVYFHDENLLSAISFDALRGNAVVGVVHLVWLAAVCWRWKLFFLPFFSLSCVLVFMPNL